MAYKSKFTGDEIDALLTKIQNIEIGEETELATKDDINTAIVESITNELNGDF